LIKIDNEEKVEKILVNDQKEPADDIQIGPEIKIENEIENEIEEPVDEVLNEILKYQTKLFNDLHYIKNNMVKEENLKESLIKWRFAAKVIDRLGFCISIVYLIATVIWLLLSLNSFYQFK